MNSNSMRLVTALLVLTVSNVLFLNLDTVTNSPMVSESVWQQTLASDRFSPAIASGSNSLALTLNDEPGSTISLGRTTIVVNAPPAPAKTWTVAPPLTGSADGLFAGLLLEIKNWQISNPGKTARLLIGRGTYRFVNRLQYPMEITGFERLIVRGDAVGEDRPKFLVSNLKRGAIRIIDSSLISLSGIEVVYELGPLENPGTADLSDNLAYGDHLAYRGRMVGANTISSDIPAELAPTIMSVRSFDPTKNIWFDRTSGVSPVHKGVWDLLDPNQGSVPLSQVGPRLFTSPSLRDFKVGENVLLIKTRKNYGGGLFIGGGSSSDITIQGLVLRNYPQMGIRIENAGRGFRIVGNRLLPKVGELLSGRADGIHIVGAKGDIVVENNWVVANGDDGINIRGTDVDLQTIERSADSKLLTVVDLTHGGSLATGDRVAIYANGFPLALARAVSVSATEFALTPEAPCDSTCLDTLVATVRQALTNERATLLNLSRTSSRFLIRENRLWRNGGRGVIVHAPNGAVRDNLIYYPALPGLIARLSDGGTISEGPGPVNVSIERNRIHGAHHGFSTRDPAYNASIVVKNTTRTDDTYRFAQRMIVRNNCISNSGHAAMSFTWTRAIEAGSNTIGAIHQAPRPAEFKPTEAVVVSNSVAFFRNPDIERPSLVCIPEE